MAVAESMAAWINAVFNVTPSPLAPKDNTLSVFSPGLTVGTKAGSPSRTIIEIFRILIIYADK
jgi:hypothetical protein